MEIRLSVIESEAIKNAVNTNAITSKDDNDIFDNNVIKFLDNLEILQYASLEKDFLELGSSTLTLYDGENYEPQGYISDKISNENRNFTLDNPKITIEFGCACSPYGLTINFDTVSNIYAEEFKITLKRSSGILKETIIIESNSSATYQFIPTDADFLKDIEGITLEFIKLNKSSVRARLFNIILGVNKYLYSKDLVDTFSCEFDVDPTNNRLPQQKMSFSIDPNYGNGLFGADNKQGIYDYLKDGQPISAKVIINYNDIKIKSEKVQICNMVLSGEISDTEKSTTINAISYLQTATEKKTFNEFGAEISLYYLLCNEDFDNPENNGVFPSMNLPFTDGEKRYYVYGMYGEDEIKDENGLTMRNQNGEIMYKENSLKTITTTAPIKNMPLKECVRIIAQAGCCVVFEDERGIIHVEPMPENEIGREYTFDYMYQIPKLKKYPQLKYVETYWYDNEGKEINKEELGDITYPAISNYNSNNGEVITIKNTILVKEKMAQKVADFMAKQLIMRNQYSTSIIGGLEIEPFDKHSTHNKICNQNSCLEIEPVDDKCQREKCAKPVCSLMTKKSLKYNGAIRSDITYFTEG